MIVVNGRIIILLVTTKKADSLQHFPKKIIGSFDVQKGTSHVATPLKMGRGGCHERRDILMSLFLTVPSRSQMT